MQKLGGGGIFLAGEVEIEGRGNQSIAGMIVSQGEHECFPNKVRIIGSLRDSVRATLPPNRSSHCVG